MPYPQLLDLLAEILTRATSKVASNLLARREVGSEDDLRSGIAEHVFVEVGRSLARDNNNDNDAKVSGLARMLQKGENPN